MTRAAYTLHAMPSEDSAAYFKNREDAQAAADAFGYQGNEIVEIRKGGWNCFIVKLGPGNWLAARLMTGFPVITLDTNHIQP